MPRKDFTVHRKPLAAGGRHYHLFGFCGTKAKADKLLKKFREEGRRARKVRGSGGYWIYTTR